MITPKNLVVPFAALFVSVLISCAPIEFEEYPDGTSRPVIEQSTTDDENAFPLEFQLMLGTLLLEGTDRAVSAEQAAVLLPLWQQWEELNHGATPAAQEKGSLLDQIQGAMTEDQLQAIAEMDLTQADLDKYMQEYGFSFLNSRGSTPEATNSDGPMSTVESSGTPAPAVPEATPDDDGGFPGFDQTQTLSPDEIATLQSVFRGYGGGSHGPTWALLHAVLHLLESKQAG